MWLAAASLTPSTPTPLCNSRRCDGCWMLLSTSLSAWTVQLCSFDWLMITYIALFSALLSRLTALACGSAWVTSFLQRIFWISTDVVYLQCWHGWCHMKLQPSRHKFCVHHTTMHHVTSCKATYFSDTSQAVYFMTLLFGTTHPPRYVTSIETNPRN